MKEGLNAQGVTVVRIISSCELVKSEVVRFHSTLKNIKMIQFNVLVQYRAKERWSIIESARIQTTTIYEHGTKNKKTHLLIKFVY
jgi:hypothetical protein